MKNRSFPVLLATLFLCGGLGASGLDPAQLSEAEWTAFRFERLTVIRSTPDLAAESRRLREETRAHEKAVEAAMIKARPAVAPLLTKRAALLNGDWSAPSEADMLSWADWQTLRSARAAALEASPELAAAAKTLREETRAFDAKADAALVQADPGLADLIGRSSRTLAP